MVGGAWQGIAEGAAGEAREFPSHAFCVSSSCPVCFPNRSAPSPRDYAWAARELGDVPFDRVIGASVHDNPAVWVESLGRDQ